MTTCEDCGSPVVMKTTGKPVMEVPYSKRDDKEVYHDKDQCIFFLRTEIEAIKKAVGLHGVR